MARRRFVVVLLPGLVWLGGESLEAGPAAGPLQVHPANPRYFMVQGDPSRKAIYLTGSHVWGNLQADLSSNPAHNIKWNDYLGVLETYGHNFIRGWHWEDAYYAPLPYARTGPGTANDGGLKFDLTRYHPDFFDRIRSRAIDAGNRGIYIGVMLFQGWSIEDKGGGRNPNPWPRHPYHSANNINGINGDTNGDGQGKEVHTLGNPAVTALQEDYVEHFIDELNDLDNVIWEISNESHSGSADWQYHIINHIHSYEAAKPKQHPVWMNCYGDDFPNAYLFNGPADVVSPHRFGPNYREPPASTGNKVAILDTDHLWGVGGNAAWVWKSLTRGYYPIFMDPLHNISWYSNAWNPSDWVFMRQAMGRARIYGEKINLANATPQDYLSSTGYCLANPGTEYLVYQSGSGSFTVNLLSGTYNYEWFNPNTGSVASTGSITWGGGSRSFTPPFSGTAVLWLDGCSGAGLPEQTSDPDPLDDAVKVARDAQLRWSVAPCADGYDVHFGPEDDGPPPLLSSAQAGISFDPGPLERLTTYHWRVDAVNGSDKTTGPTWRFTTVSWPGDFDYDSDVDQADFGHFQSCLSGPVIPYASGCEATDLDSSGTTDQNDLNIFLSCMGGPGQTPGC